MAGDQAACFVRRAMAGPARAAWAFTRLRDGRKVTGLRSACRGALMLCGSRPHAGLRAMKEVHGLSDKT
jgi:hypothetical protein